MSRAPTVIMVFVLFPVALSGCLEGDSDSARTSTPPETWVAHHETQLPLGYWQCPLVGGNPLDCKATEEAHAWVVPVGARLIAMHVEATADDGTPFVLRISCHAGGSRCNGFPATTDNGTPAVVDVETSLPAGTAFRVGVRHAEDPVGPTRGNVGDADILVEATYQADDAFVVEPRNTTYDDVTVGCGPALEGLCWPVAQGVQRHLDMPTLFDLRFEATWQATSPTSERMVLRLECSPLPDRSGSDACAAGPYEVTGPSPLVLDLEGRGFPAGDRYVAVFPADGLPSPPVPFSMAMTYNVTVPA